MHVNIIILLGHLWTVHSLLISTWCKKITNPLLLIVLFFTPLHCIRLIPSVHMGGESMLKQAKTRRQ